MKKFALFLLPAVFILLLPSFSKASSATYELKAGPEQAFTCRQTVSDSRTFSDESSRLLWNITAGGNVGADDAAFIYKDGSQIAVATHCNNINSPSDLKCNKACAGSTNIWWGNYFQDSGAGNPDSVTFSGTAYETYQPTNLTTHVAFDSFLVDVVWSDCIAGQRVDNGQCVPITGSITPDKTSCTEPCDVVLDWDTNSYLNATITENGDIIASPTTNSGVSNTNTSGTVSRSGLAGGVTYTYCIEGNDGFGNSVGDLNCNSVVVDPASLPSSPPLPSISSSVIPTPSPTASLTANGGSSISVNVGDTVNYTWSSSNGDQYTSYLAVAPSSPDPCGNRTGSVDDFNSPGGSLSASIASCQAGFSYTFTYTVTQTSTGNTAQDSVTVNVAAIPPPPGGSCDYFASPGVPFPCDENGDGCSGIKYCLPGPPPNEGNGTWSECFNDICPVINSPPTASSITITQPDYCVSGPAAFVSWTYSDPNGDPQSAYQVQVDDQGSFQSPEADSGKIMSSNTSYFVNNLQFDITYKARVRVWDSQDAVSGWSVSGSWKTPQHAYPIVNFTWSPLLSPVAKQLIQFTDQTQFFDTSGVGQRGWSWLFGDGGSSTVQNPSHTYPNPGTYNVTDTATDKDGLTCSLTKPIGIERPIPVWKEVSPK